MMYFNVVFAKLLSKTINSKQKLAHKYRHFFDFRLFFFSKVKGILVGMQKYFCFC